MKAILLVGLVLLAGILGVACDSKGKRRAGDIPLTEHETLIALYEASNGADWGDDDKWLSDEPVSEWKGVEVSDGHVVGVELRFNDLRNQIPTEIGQLRNLRYLYLMDNRLEGNLPKELAQCGKLEELEVSRNRLSGKVPVEMLLDLERLSHLDLSYNDFRGSVPAELGRVESLEHLDLRENLLRGNIPATLGDLTRLENLGLGGNQLEGAIPPALGKLKELVTLELHENELNGEIPRELGKLEKLKRLDLSDNPLRGRVPKELMGISLERFSFEGTDLCEPSSGEFQNWLDGIPELERTGVICGD